MTTVDQRPSVRSRLASAGRALHTKKAKLLVAWHELDLSRQFLLGAVLIMLPAMLIAGSWVSRLIKDGVIRNSTPPAALVLENFVEPLLQSLVPDETLAAADRLALDRLLFDSTLGRNVASFKIWLPGGRVVYSSRVGVAGKVFPLGPKQRAAWRGLVAADFSDLKDEEHATERGIVSPLLEIYFPVRQRGSDRIIAVAEFYQTATEISRELLIARLKAWGVIGFLTLALLSTLFGIVRRGSRIIQTQKEALHQRVDELTHLLDENLRLKNRLQTASSRASEHNEFFLRRLGADIHDGPAQLVSAALLRIDERSGKGRSGNELAEPSRVRQILEEALQSLRNLASGLSVPEIEQLTLADTIGLAVRKHEALTGTTVDYSTAPELAACSSVGSASAKLCAYRFAQEGLANAWRHAEAKEQSVSALADGDILVIEVRDRGQGFDWQRIKPSGRLGVRGLADRIESLGGSFEIDSIAGRGTTLLARIPMGAANA